MTMQVQCRLSRPSSSELCGRITMFLTPLLPLLDRSGLNVQCAFNDSHSTPVEDVPEVSPPSPHAIPMTDAPRRRMCPTPVRSMCNAPSTLATPHPLRMCPVSRFPSFVACQTYHTAHGARPMTWSQDPRARRALAMSRWPGGEEHVTKALVSRVMEPDNRSHATRDLKQGP